MSDPIRPPEHLNDGQALLGERGFTTGHRWYHGTSSALVDPILHAGLKRSGDREMQAATEKTMATIGNSYQATTEPVYLTPSKALAYYWALQTVRRRRLRFGSDEQPAVLSVTLPDDLNGQVKPDVGAATLLLAGEGEAYMAYVARIYQDCGLAGPDIDLMKANRLEYLQTLGMAYIDSDIDAAHLAPVRDDA